eukprot:TRINITY_DN30097_c0_g2_i1.p1 TRINITY_DN30097_c0_g2~~TRINITY_DN30097_c0_g2_i1.p1  ORF type:complete len:621 (+),score=189.02 TRINITY_DN30097_c0_g2_i1:68-1930(+)
MAMIRRDGGSGSDLCPPPDMCWVNINSSASSPQRGSRCRRQVVLAAAAVGVVAGQAPSFLAAPSAQVPLRTGMSLSPAATGQPPPKELAQLAMMAKSCAGASRRAACFGASRRNLHAPVRSTMQASRLAMSLLVAPNVLLLFLALRIWQGGRRDIQDGDAMQEMWASYAKRPAARAAALMAGAVRVGFIALRAKLARDPEKKSKLFRQAGKKAVKELVKLGPTYVKAGQIISCRPDLIPDECVEELKILQQEVPAFGGERAIKILEAELGKPVGELLKEFDREPIAAASLGQVHRGVLHDGTEVCIKIQRDQLKEMFDLDLSQFDKITQALDKYKIGVKGATQMWTDMFGEAKVILYREIDYKAEADNLRRTEENFRETPWIKIPKVIDELSSSKVLTMEYVPGIKIDAKEKLEAIPGMDRKMLGRHLALCYLLQFCKHGFFNTDPHPGNLAVDDKYKGGRLIFYDFGQACELTHEQTDGILQVIQSIMDFDAKACVVAMQNLGALKKEANIKALETLIDNNFKTGKVKSKRSKRKQEYVPEDGVALDKIPQEKEVAGYLQLPSQLAFVARALTQMQGVGLMLDEEWEFIDLVADKVPELQVEKGAGLGYIVGQFFKQRM